jgi:hypothetical protein
MKWGQLIFPLVVGEDKIEVLLAIYLSSIFTIFVVRMACVSAFPGYSRTGEL